MLPKLVQKCAIKGFTASLLRNISSFFLPFRVWLSENNCVILHQMKLYHHEKFIELKSSTALYENRGNWAQCRNDKVNWKIEFQALGMRIQCLVKLVFCYQNCSDLLWEKNVLVIEKTFWNSRLKAENWQKILSPLEQFFQTVKGQNNFW